MTKTLNVIKPFMHLVPGDTFELNEDGSYTAKQHDEFTRTDDSGDFESSLTSEFTVSADYMKEISKITGIGLSTITSLLLENGISLEEMKERLRIELDKLT